MASFTDNKIGLTIPNMPPTPCDGRAQHYHRPGDPKKQMTRAFPNGTTLTFGPQDIVGEFKAGDAFYEQFLMVQAVKEEILTIRQQYRAGGYAATYEDSETDGSGGQSRFENGTGSSNQNSSQSLNSIAETINGGHQAFDPSYMGPIRHASDPGHISPVQHAFDSGPAQQAFDPGHMGPVQRKFNPGHMGTVQREFNPGHMGTVQREFNPGYTGPIQQEFDSGHIRPVQQGFDSGHMGPVQQAFTLSSHHPDGNNSHNLTRGSRKSRRRQFANQAFNGNTHGDSNMFNSPGLNAGFPSQSYLTGSRIPTANQAAVMGIQGPQLSMTTFPHLGFPPNNHGTGSYMLVAQQPSAIMAQGSIPAATSFPHPEFPHNSHGTSSLVPPITEASTMIGQDRKLPGVAHPHPGLPYDDQDPGWNMPADLHASVMALRDPRYPPAILPHPWNTGPVLYMNPWHYDRMLIANGVTPPAPGFLAVPNYYFGPLHYSTAVEAIKMAADFGKKIHDETMLEPFVMPLICYHPATTQIGIHMAECERHKRLMQEVLAVRSESGGPIIWYRILGDLNKRREPVAWHPQVIDLFRHESHYKHLLARDINPRNSNEKGLGRKDSPFKGHTQEERAAGADKQPQKQSRKEAAVKVEKQLEEKPRNGTTAGLDTGVEKQTVTAHIREDSDDTSAFFKEDNHGLSLSRNDVHHFGCSTPGREQLLGPEAYKTPQNRRPLGHPNRSREYQAEAPDVSPAPPPSRILSLKSSAPSKSPLLDFDERYSATHGDEREVDFATRDKGPPRFDGKTFNEAIGFRPVRRHSSATPSCYPIKFRKPPPRD